ncbi:MAG: HTTM domain-containing protein, partial [Planctomycetota bacterium]
MLAPVDIAPLVYFRVVFGAVMLWKVVRYFRHGWIERYYIEPQLYFAYYGFEWVRPWPGVGMYWHFIGLGLLATCILLGLFYRLAAGLFFLGFAYVFLLDETNYLNHFYLISLVSLLMVFLPAHRAASLDAARRPGWKSDRVAAWSLWLLRFQVAVPYVFGALAKMNPDWLRGEPMRLWLAERAETPLLQSLLTQEWFVYGMSYGGLLFDLLVVPLLLWSRTRWLAVGLTVVFHVTNAFLFDIGVFPWLMLLATPIFFPPASLRRAAEVFGATPAAVGGPAAMTPTPTARQRAWFFAVGLYVFLQVVMPFRPWLYPGDPSWTEQGHRFSWHMKLRDKRGAASFLVRDPASGESWVVRPETYLTRRQLVQMPTHPDMVLRFAHFLEQEWRRRGHADVAVYADARVSLNGRPAEPLVDCNVDLTEERRSLMQSTW